MNDHVGNWNKTRMNSFFGHHVYSYLELLGARGYLFNSLIFPHSLRGIKDFGIQLTHSAVFAEIYIFLKSTFSNLTHGWHNTLFLPWKFKNNFKHIDAFNILLSSYEYLIL